MWWGKKPSPDYPNEISPTLDPPSKSPARKQEGLGRQTRFERTTERWYKVLLKKKAKGKMPTRTIIVVDIERNRENDYIVIILSDVYSAFELIVS